MSEAALLEPGVADPTPAAHRLHFGVLEVAGRLGALLGKDHEATGFLAALGERALAAELITIGPHPIDRFANGLGLEQAEIDVLLLAGAADEHEGLASVLRGLHPRGEPVPTAGLVAALAEAGLLPAAPPDPTDARLWARALLARGPLGLFLVAGPPFPERSLVLPDGLWAALHGEPGWPARACQLDHELTATVPLGLDTEDPGLRAALVACSRGVAATILVDGAGDPTGAAVPLRRPGSVHARRGRRQPGAAAWLGGAASGCASAARPAWRRGRSGGRVGEPAGGGLRGPGAARRARQPVARCCVPGPRAADRV